MMRKLFSWGDRKFSFWIVCYNIELKSNVHFTEDATGHHYTRDWTPVRYCKTLFPAVILSYALRCFKKLKFLSDNLLVNVFLKETSDKSDLLCRRQEIRRQTQASMGKHRLTNQGDSCSFHITIAWASALSAMDVNVHFWSFTRSSPLSWQRAGHNDWEDR